MRFSSIWSVIPSPPRKPQGFILFFLFTLASLFCCSSKALTYHVLSRPTWKQQLHKVQFPQENHKGRNLVEQRLLGSKIKQQRFRRVSVSNLKVCFGERRSLSKTLLQMVKKAGMPSTQQLNWQAVQELQLLLICLKNF